MSAKDNVVVLFFIERSGDENTLYVYSKDHGATWSEPVHIPMLTGRDDDQAQAMPGPGTALITSTDRVMFIAHHGVYTLDSVYYSDNLLGQLLANEAITEATVDWKMADSDFQYMDEGFLVERSDGRIVANMRHVLEGSLGKAVSVSSLPTVGEVLNFAAITYDRKLYGPVCQANGVTGYTPNVMYFSNPRNKFVRKDTTVQVSYDDGKSFSKTRMPINNDPSGGYSVMVPGNLIVGAEDGKNVGGIIFESTADTSTASVPPHVGDGAAIKWTYFEVPAAAA